MNKYIEVKDSLLNESDVEQKIVYELLTNDLPVGLGYNSLYFQTKLNLKKIKIGKRDNAKLYYPDYVIMIDGIPLIVIEVKRPDEDLNEAFREARLYACEINAMFPNELNPCEKVFVSNGEVIHAGVWDNNTPTLSININNWISTDAEFSKFQDSYSYYNINKNIKQIKASIRSKIAQKKPTMLLGGKHVRNQLVQNSFGETISIEYSHLFNPTNEGERSDIVKNAYVKVTKHQSHVDPINKVIRKKVLPNIDSSVEIKDNIEPDEVLDKLNNANAYNNQVILLIGSVGSGKSTFATYLREVALPKDLKDKLSWIRIDLNDAPINGEEIYKWIKGKILESIECDNKGVNFHDLTTIKKIYYRELRKFNSYAKELLGEDSTEYKQELYNEIKRLKNDVDIKISEYLHYFIHNRKKELVIVLDNCDKRNKDEQLLMFEVANWMKENIKCIVFLPLRETTFDHYRNEKPLDTVVKDLVFRINPPTLEKVIINRIKYATRNSGNTHQRKYNLVNGINIKYPSGDELSYLKSILKSLFQDKFFKKLISGLAGRDIRKGIEIFLDFCKSGHILDSDILQMKQTNGEYKLPSHIISRVFMRGDRLYYSDSVAKVKNLFLSSPDDDLPDPFVRVSILEWLDARRYKAGPSGITGFHRLSDLVKDLIALGHNVERIKEEIRNLVLHSLILSESQRIDKVELEDLITINSSGMIHLDLLKNITYLSTVAEDVWYEDECVANDILNRISNNTPYEQFSREVSLLNSNSLLKYLDEYYSKYFKFSNNLLNEDIVIPPIDFTNIIDHIDKKNEIENHSLEEYDDGTKLVAKICRVYKFGILCELPRFNQFGFIKSIMLDDDFTTNDIYIKNKKINVEVICFNTRHRKYELKLQ